MVTETVPNLAPGASPGSGLPGVQEPVLQGVPAPETPSRNYRMASRSGNPATIPRFPSAEMGLAPR
jgi:hypothetical protein